MRHDFKNKKLVIFDWDGTLFDSTGIIGHALQQSCAAINQPIPTLREAQKVIGLGFTEAIEALVGPLNAAQTELFMQSYRRHYFSGEEIVTLFDDITNLIDGLRAQSTLTAVATGKSRVGLNRVLQHASLKNRFDATRTADETASKPHPLMLFQS
jgi:phosphoglycolate phosphatase